MASLGGKQLSQFRVADLRTELENRGLDNSGLKGALVERLEKSLLDYSAEPNECVFSSELQGNEAKKTAESEATQTPNSNLEAINKQSLQMKTAGKLSEQSIEINTATRETNCKETMTEFNPVPNKVDEIGILHRRINNIEDSLRREISNIVVEINAIPRHEYSRDYTSLLTKQKEDLTNVTIIHVSNKKTMSLEID